MRHAREAPVGTLQTDRVSSASTADRSRSLRAYCSRRDSRERSEKTSALCDQRAFRGRHPTLLLGTNLNSDRRFSDVLLVPTYRRPYQHDRGSSGLLEVRQQATRPQLTAPRLLRQTLSHLDGSGLAYRDFRSGSPANRSGSQRLGPPAATIRQSVALVPGRTGAAWARRRCPRLAQAWVSVSAASMVVAVSGAVRLGGRRSRGCRCSRGRRPSGCGSEARGRRATLPQRRRRGVGGSLTRTPLRRAYQLRRPCSLPIVRA
jgi:hypothetical protein